MRIKTINTEGQVVWKDLEEIILEERLKQGGEPIVQQEQVQSDPV